MASSDERTPRGDPVLRHEAAGSDSAPAREGRYLELISDHVEKHVGPIESVFHEIFSEYVHVDVHWIPPHEERPCHTLVTSGMSDRPMSAPEGAEECTLAELMISLPPDWKVDQESFKDEASYWPVRLLKFLARMPHVYDTWLWYGHTIPHGDPPDPYARSTKLCGAMLALSPTLPDEFYGLEVPDGPQIMFFSILPLLQDEMDYKLQHGADALLDRFDERGVLDVVDPKRKSVCRRRSWNPFAR